jgi:hypothetical protein
MNYTFLVFLIYFLCYFSNSIAQNNNCVRGQAEPVVKKLVYPNSQFQLQADSLRAIEIVNFSNGDKLIIRNWGCESYILTFGFETSRFLDTKNKLGFWLEKAIILMKEVENGINAPINIKKGIKALEKHLKNSKKNNYKDLKLEEEINFEDNIEIRDFVRIDKVEKQENKKLVLEISFGSNL